MMYLPEDNSALRVYNWLANQAKIRPNMYFPREMLLDKLMSVGVGKEHAWQAVKSLEGVIDVASFWDSSERTVFYSVVLMTPEEKLARIDDHLWFEDLP